jgi:putative DNA primase/helicase
MAENGTIAAAEGRWREILPHFGVELKALDGKHHPCPVCGGDDRFRFDDKDGSGSWYCHKGHNGKEAGYGMDLAMMLNGGDFLETASRIDRIIGREFVPDGGGARLPQPRITADDQTRSVQGYIAKLKTRSLRVEAGDPVDLWLRYRVPGLKAIPSVLRFVPDGEYRDKVTKVVTRHPMMLATVRDSHGDPVAIHRTFLSADGRKADVADVRLSLGSLPEGIAVRLAAAKGTTLGIAEGIETALSAMAMHRIPVWSVLNAGRMEVWSPPQGVEAVVFFADADANKVGQAAAYAAAKRLEAKGLITQVEIPPVAGTDWNDVHRQRAAEPA